MASAALRDTRRRIRSVEAIKKITRAMELIAASRIPKAVARVNASKPYTAKLIEVIETVGGASSADATHMLLEQRAVNTDGVVEEAADGSLAGAHWANNLRMTELAIIEERHGGRGMIL